MKIVILGGSGFLGRSLTRQLCHSEHQVVTVSRSPIAALAANHQHSDITLDDRRALADLLADADYVFDVAGDTTPGSSQMQPILEGVNNILPLMSLLDCMQELSRPTLVYVSSGGAVYDTASAGGQFTEASSTRPLSYYGAGKLAAEQFITAFAHQSKHSAFILRPANIYGPGQVAKKQFGIVPTLFDAISTNKPFTIWGDGSAVRDYLYIEDFLKLSLKIIEYPWPAQSRELFNVGSGQGHSILELCNAVEKVTGRSLHIDHRPARGVDIKSVVLDSNRARNMLQWTPATDLHTGVEKTWEWYLGQAS